MLSMYCQAGEPQGCIAQVPLPQGSGRWAALTDLQKTRRRLGPFPQAVEVRDPSLLLLAVSTGVTSSSLLSGNLASRAAIS